MTEVELNDKRNAVNNAGVVFTATAIPLKEAQIHISLDIEEGGQVIYNPIDITSFVCMMPSSNLSFSG